MMPERLHNLYHKRDSKMECKANMPTVGGTEHIHSQLKGFFHESTKLDKWRVAGAWAHRKDFSLSSLQESSDVVMYISIYVSVKAESSHPREASCRPSSGDAKLSTYHWMNEVFIARVTGLSSISLKSRILLGHDCPYTPLESALFTIQGCVRTFWSGNLCEDSLTRSWTHNQPTKLR